MPSLSAEPDDDTASLSSASTSSSSSSAHTPRDDAAPQTPPVGDSWHLEIVDEYRRYVRPTWKPQLSEFCTELTGITQETVDSAETFKQVLQDFEATFCKQHSLFTPENSTVWVTDGPWVCEVTLVNFRYADGPRCCRTCATS